MKRGNVYRSLATGTTYRVCGQRRIDGYTLEWELLPMQLSPLSLDSLQGDHARDVKARQTSLEWEDYLARHLATPIRVETQWFQKAATLELEV